MMFSFPRTSALALITAAMLALVAATPARAAVTPTVSETPQPRFELPAKPSEMLRAPQSTWEPLLKQVAAVLNERAGAADTLDKPAQIELHIQRTVLAQARQDWQAVLDGVKKARQLQGSESGRQTAGLLNEVLARQAMAGGDAAWLQRHVRDQVLAMPWADVQPTIHTLRDQLAAVKAETIEAVVAGRMDVAASIGSNFGNVSFVLQLLALRFQLLEVMPRRDALVAGLDEAIAQRGEAK